MNSSEIKQSPRSGGKKLEFTKLEVKKTLRGFGLSTLGAIILVTSSQLINFIHDIPNQYDFGPWQGIIMALSLAIINAIKEWIQDNSNKFEYDKKNIKEWKKETDFKDL